MTRAVPSAVAQRPWPQRPLFASGYVKAIEEHRDRLLKQLEDLEVQKENLPHLQKAQLLQDLRTGDC